MPDAQYFLEKSERFFRMARANRQLADELEALGNDFMAKAVELDTNRDKATRQT
jgi:hypothetical protein